MDWWALILQALIIILLVLTIILGLLQLKLGKIRQKEWEAFTELAESYVLAYEDIAKAFNEVKAVVNTHADILADLQTESAILESVIASHSEALGNFNLKVGAPPKTKNIN